MIPKVHGPYHSVNGAMDMKAEMSPSVHGYNDHHDDNVGEPPPAPPDPPWSPFTTILIEATCCVLPVKQKGSDNIPTGLSGYPMDPPYPVSVCDVLE